MNGLLSMIGMQTELEYQMGDDFPFGSPRIRFNVPKGNIPSDKQKCQPKIEVRYIKPQVVKLHSRVTMSNFEMQYYCRDKFGMEQLKRRAIESVYDEILKGMKANGLVPISQYKDIYTNSTIYEGTCEIYKNK